MTHRLLFLFVLFLSLSTAICRKQQTSAIRRLRKNEEEVCVTVDDDTARSLQPGRPGMDLSVLRMEHFDPCQILPLAPSAGRTFAVLSGSCSLRVMRQRVKDAGGAAMMVVANITLIPLRLDVGSDKGLPVVVVARNLYTRLINNSQSTVIKFELLPALDTGRGMVPIVVFPVFAFICLAVGMWFSVNGRVDVNPNFVFGGPWQRSPSEEPLTGFNMSNASANNSIPTGQDCAFCSNVCCIALFVVFSATSLLLLYYFYDVFVWIMIVFICIFFTTAFKSMIMEGIVRISEAWNERSLIHINKPCARECIGDSIDKRSLMILPLCAVPAIIWLVFRKSPNVWIVQDICGIVACIHIIKVIRFGSLKTITLMGVLFFIYDVFMVYITPLLMPRQSPEHPAASFTYPLFHNASNRVRRSAPAGMSVMEAVATGAAGSSGEKLPILFIVPAFNFDGSSSLQMSRSPFMRCYNPSSGLLGFGDICLPGILLAYAFWCDTYLRSATRQFPWLYSIVGLIGYEVGLGLVYVLLYAMGTGQPALLMLIPCTLLPFLIIAAIRKEFLVVWNGFEASGLGRPAQLSNVAGDGGEGGAAVRRDAESSEQTANLVVKAEEKKEES